MKPLSAFHKDYRSKSGTGLRPYCKDCEQVRRATYYTANKEKVRAAHAAYYAANREKVKAQQSAKYQTAEYRERDRVRRRAPKYRAAKRARHVTRISVDTEFRVQRSLRDRFNKALKNNYTKQSSAVRDLGCTVDELKQMLQPDLDRYGFTWADHGTRFHIDHIVPLASFNLQCRGQQLRAVHFTNLGVLSIEENLSKGDTDPHEWAELQQRQAWERYRNEK